MPAANPRSATGTTTKSGADSPAAPEAGQPVVVVGCDDEFLRGREVAAAVRAVRARVKRSAGPPGDAEAEVELSDWAGPEVSADELVAAFSPSLFGGWRVVVVRDVQDAPAEVTEALLRCAADPGDELVVLLTWPGGAKGRGVIDRLAKLPSVTVRNIPPVKTAAERERFVTAEAKASGAEFTPGAVRALLGVLGSDLRELAIAVSQLAADSAGRVDEDLVARYYRGRGDASSFAVADRALEGDPAGALEVLRWALSTGQSPAGVTAALAMSLRSVAGVAGVRGNAFALAKQLGQPVWRIEKAQRQAAGWTPDGVADALRAVAAADAAVKGGEVATEYALERAVLAISTSRGAAAR